MWGGTLGIPAAQKDVMAGTGLTQATHYHQGVEKALEGTRACAFIVGAVLPKSSLRKSPCI